MSNIMRACFDEYVNPEVWKSVKPWERKGAQMADYGYAITVHKAQGSQWPRVAIFEENALNWPAVRDARKQWLYTGVTRAAEKLTVIMGKV